MRIINGRFSTFVNRLSVLAVIAVATVVLTACPSTAEGVPSTPPTETPEPTATPAPTPTRPLLQDFTLDEVPDADPAQLAKLLGILALVPDEYDSAVRLDLEAVRTDPVLSEAITAESLGADSGLPSLVTGLIDDLVVAVDPETKSLATGFSGELDLEQVLNLAGNFGLKITGDGPESYGSHKIWQIEFLGATLTMATASETTGVAATSSDPAADVNLLVKQVLDTFDGDHPRFIDARNTSLMLESIPSGFAAAVIADCGRLNLLSDIDGLPGCEGAAASASRLGEDAVVVHALVGFGSEALAADAVEMARTELQDEVAPRGLRGVGVAQDGSWVRVRVITDLPNFDEAFELFQAR